MPNQCSVLPWTFLDVKGNSSLGMTAWGDWKQVLALSLDSSEFFSLSQEFWESGAQLK